VDFEDSPELAAFRAEVREFLDAHAELRHGDDRDWSRNGAALDPDVAADYRRRCIEWQGLLYESGWAGLTWPTAFGGRGLTAAHQIVFNQELARYDATSGFLTAAMALVGPTLMAHGSPEQQARYVGPLLSGKEAWCQLFSEPGAGSDLAALATRAVRDGDEWVVNGQKVWTSAAHYANRGILLARTDVDVPKHKGISAMVIDMNAPGVEVRPIRQIDGAIHFNEVFLTDVRVPVANTLGPEGMGWPVALTMLGHERASIGGGGMYTFEQVVQLAQECGRADDPVIRQRLVDLYEHFELLRFIGYRVKTALAKGEMPGGEASVMKLLVSELYERGGDLMVEILGAGGMLTHEDAPYGGRFTDLFMGQWAPRIGGGTDQVQRNVIGERVLGLPGDLRADKTLPFKDLPKS
jgi:alkylation response protein AidB-like acyl-CoA dehydrogenase